jgi:hypothetical protein
MSRFHVETVKEPSGRKVQWVKFNVMSPTYGPREYVCRNEQWALFKSLVSPIGRNSGVLIGGEPHQNSVSPVSSNSGGFCGA